MGVAIALNRPLIIMTQDEEIPFDIKHLRITRYELSEAGKNRIKKELASILQKSINSTEKILRKMLVCAETENHIVYGYATKEHIEHVFPHVDEKYEQRLRGMSSEAFGISQLTIAFQKIAWSMGNERIGVIPVNGYMAPDDIFLRGNVYVFGGPGANPLFYTVTDLANRIYANALNIQCELVSDSRKRYYISRSGKKYPNNQYKLYEERKDIGFVMRLPNPECENAVIIVAAGLRSYGTEGAIKLLVTPSLISKLGVYPNLDVNNGFWALVEVLFDDENKHVNDITIVESEILIKRTAN